MANLNRRSKSSGTPDDSIEALKAEIDALKALYQHDMGNISLDMRALSGQIQAAAVVEPVSEQTDA